MCSVVSLGSKRNAHTHRLHLEHWLTLRFGTHLFSVTTLFNWSQKLFFHGENSISSLLFHVAHVGRPHAWPSGWVEQSRGLTGKQVIWADRASPLAEVVCTFGGQDLSSHWAWRWRLQPTTPQIYHKKEERCLEKKTPKPKGCVQSLRPPMPTHCLLCYKSQQTPSFDEGQLWLRFSIQKRSYYDRTQIWIWLST